MEAERFENYPDLGRGNNVSSRIIERLDRKLADVIGSNIVGKCDVTLSRAIHGLLHPIC